MLKLFCWILLYMTIETRQLLYNHQRLEKFVCLPTHIYVCINTMIPVSIPSKQCNIKMYNQHQSEHIQGQLHRCNSSYQLVIQDTNLMNNHIKFKLLQYTILEFIQSNSYIQSKHKTLQFSFPFISFFLSFLG